MRVIAEYSEIFKLLHIFSDILYICSCYLMTGLDADGKCLQSSDDDMEDEDCLPLTPPADIGDPNAEPTGKARPMEIWWVRGVDLVLQSS